MTDQHLPTSAGTFDLSGRTVLITGASAGIGRHFATILARSGANLVLAARRVTLLDELREDIERIGSRAIAVAMDVTDEDSTIAAYDEAAEAFGSVDSVIANAGLGLIARAIEIDMGEFDRIVAVNLRGVFLTAREGARRMMARNSAERGHGRIVIMSSIIAHQASANMAPYAASKAAALQLGRSLAKEWATKGINVNVICPGYIRTDMNSEMLDSKSGDRLRAGFVRGRTMTLDSLDTMLLYLCSDASARVTGSVFTLDDGQSL